MKTLDVPFEMSQTFLTRYKFILQNTFFRAINFRPLHFYQSQLDH